jgi:orotate phosphoribosyltransferase
MFLLKFLKLYRFQKLPFKQIYINKSVMNQESKNNLIKEIHQHCYLTGSFTLRSGKTATDYFDKYCFEAIPILLYEITKEMVDLIPSDTEVLAGLEMGGIPVVTMLAYHSGLPSAFVRKKAKEYGTAKLCEGSDIQGKKVLIVEDIITSGGQVAISSEELRILGATINNAICVIDRQEGGFEILKEKGVNLRSLLNRDDFSLINKLAQ